MFSNFCQELITKKPNWEIEWLTKRTRAFEKSLSQPCTTKHETLKEEHPQLNTNESKVGKSFFEKDVKKDREKEKYRDRDKYKKEFERSRKNNDLKNQLSPDKESNDTNNVSLSDWMKPVDLPVEKSMITLKESVQKSKDKLHKNNKTDEIDENKSVSSDVRHVKKQRHEEPKPTIVYDKKDENLTLSQRNKIKLPFIGKMPFAKPIIKKTNSCAKDIPNFTIECTTDAPKDNCMDSVAIQKMLIEKMINAENEKKVQ